MRHQGTKRLETERLILRRFAEADAESVFKNWASDPEVTKFLRWKSHTCVEESRELLAGCVKRYVEADYYHWAIEEKGSDSGAVGYIGVFWSDETVDSVEVGYSLGRRWQGRGYMSEALRAVIDFLIDEAGANRVVAAHDPRNAASGGVMQRCGMEYEGTMRQVDRNNQGICDLSFYAVLASDRR
ncbi:GNAT family N-acetyltransferase [Cloacibacillus porcorum]